MTSVSCFKVRFVATSSHLVQTDRSPPAQSSTRPQRSNSRHGCWECKLRKVKCDETHPVCLRCQRRRSICLADPRPARWQIQIPQIAQPALFSSWPDGAVPNNRLLQYWLEQASHLLTLYHNSNPLSFPLVKYLTTSASLIHAVQSISAGHEGFFTDSHLETCLEERGRALQLVRDELRRDESPSVATLLTIFLLGVSSPWIESWPCGHGGVHLRAARTFLRSILANNNKHQLDPLVNLLLGWYLYWDMASSFVCDPQDGSDDFDPADIISLLQRDPQQFHPMIGFSSQLYILLASVGRYCRTVIDTQSRDPAWEAQAEQQLLAWQSNDPDEYMRDLSMAFRNHGLLMLYNTCASCQQAHEAGPSLQDDPDKLQQTEAFIRQLALESVTSMLRVPVSESHAIFQPMPLLTAAAELLPNDKELREEVIVRFQGLYSTTRVLVNLWSIDILKKLWDFRDCGVTISWMELCHSQGWKICFS